MFVGNILKPTNRQFGTGQYPSQFQCPIKKNRKILIGVVWDP